MKNPEILLKGDNTFHVIFPMNITRQSDLDLIKRRVSMRDQRCDLDLLLLDLSQRVRVNRGAPIKFKSTGRSDRTHEHRFLKKYAAQHAEIRSRVTMSVQQHCRLLADEPGHRMKHITRSRSLDQVLNTLAARVLVDEFHEVCAAWIDRLVSAETFREVALPLIRIADEKQAFVREYVAQVLCEQHSRWAGAAY